MNDVTRTSKEKVEHLRDLRVRLKSGEYTGTDIMHAWIVIGEYADALERTAGEPFNHPFGDHPHQVCACGAKVPTDTYVLHTCGDRLTPKRAENEPAAGCAQCSNVAPIAKLTVRDGLAVRAGLYAPGLPDGEHDVYPAASSQPPGVGPLKLDTDRQVFFYEQDHYYLSNFSAFNLRWCGRTFATSEAAYHWEKFGPAPEIGRAIELAPSAHEAFKLAERHKGLRRKDWDGVKVEIMRRILRAKAEQHEYVRRKLLETGDRELIENSWRDDVWGWGPNRDGQNLLGKLWMEIRAELRASAPTKEGDQ